MYFNILIHMVFVEKLLQSIPVFFFEMCTPEHDCHAQRTFLLKSKSQQKTTMQKMYKPSKIKCPFRWRWKASWYSKQKNIAQSYSFRWASRARKHNPNFDCFRMNLYIATTSSSSITYCTNAREFFERLIKNLLRSVRRENNFSVFRRLFFVVQKGFT